MPNDYSILTAALKRRRGSRIDMDGVLEDEEEPKKSKKTEHQSVQDAAADGMAPGRINPVTSPAPLDEAAEKQWADNQSPVAKDSPAPRKNAQVSHYKPDDDGEPINEEVYDQMIDHRRLSYMENNGIDKPKSLWDKVQLKAKRKRGRK